MANAAFELGWETAQKNRDAKRQRKELLEDEARQNTVADLHSQRSLLQAKISSLPTGSADYTQATTALGAIDTQLNDIYHPAKNPGALQKDFAFLKGLITRQKPVQPIATAAPPVGTTTNPGAAISAAPQAVKLPDMDAYRRSAPDGKKTVTPGAKGDSGSLPDAPSAAMPGGTYKVTGPTAQTADTMAIPTHKIDNLVAPGNVKIWDNRAAQNDDGSKDHEYPTTFKDEDRNSPYFGKEIVVPTVVDGKFLTPDGKKPPEGSPEMQAMLEKARDRYRKTGQHLGVFSDHPSADKYVDALNKRNDKPRPNAKSYTTPQQREQQKRQDQVAKQVEADIASAPLSPQQQAETEAAAQGAKNLAYINQAKRDYKTINPNATPEEETEFFNRLVSKTYGFPQDKAVWKEYLLPNGTKTYLDASRPDLIPVGATATGTETADMRKRSDYAKYMADHPEYKGTFEQWAVEQSQFAKLAVPTQRDDRFIAIEQKKRLGQPVTNDEQAYSDAYNLYIKQRIEDPIRVRAAANAADRFTPVQNPDDPMQIILMPAGQAAAMRVGTPASIAFQTQKVMSKYMTTGAGGANLVAFNTAVDHLKLLGETANALDNSDYPRYNQLANSYKTATGEAAPTNFDAVKVAVSGELAKVFGGRATVEEIAQINQEINSAQSPQQIQGVINHYVSLMGSRVTALKAQYDAGMQGSPAFNGATPTPAAPQQSKGLVSINDAMKNKPKYKGMSRDAVRLAIMKQGYTPTE